MLAVEPDPEVRRWSAAEVRSRLTACRHELPFETHVHWTQLADANDQSPSATASATS